MPNFWMGEHVRVRAQGLDFYGHIRGFGTDGGQWRYSVESFDMCYCLFGLSEQEIESIEIEDISFDADAFFEGFYDFLKRVGWTRGEIWSRYKSMFRQHQITGVCNVQDTVQNDLKKKVLNLIRNHADAGTPYEELVRSDSEVSVLLQEIYPPIFSSHRALLCDFRHVFVRHYAWAIPTPPAIDALVNLSPITEIGAGGGYWAYRVREAGGTIHAYDSKIPIHEREDIPEFSRKAVAHWTWEDTIYKFWVDIEKCEPIWTVPAETTLFICWPNFGDTAAAKYLRRYQGENVVYVGEAADGNCAEASFFDALETYWEPVNTLWIPQFLGCFDGFVHYKRRKEYP